MKYFEAIWYIPLYISAKVLMIVFRKIAASGLSPEAVCIFSFSLTEYPSRKSMI